MREKQKKKIFALSDIHGHATLMKQALLSAGFDKDNDDHFLVVLGDLFDRGSENRAVWEYLRGVKNKVIIRGNHEDILEKSLISGVVNELQFANGTASTLLEFFRNYSGGAYLRALSGVESDLRDRLLRHINATYDYFETENYIFVHGFLPISPEGSLDGYTYADGVEWHKARWDRWPYRYGRFEIPLGKTLVVGHTPTGYYAAGFEEGRQTGDYSIFYGERMIAIDGGTVNSGIVNVLVLEDYVDVPKQHHIPSYEGEIDKIFEVWGHTWLLRPISDEMLDIALSDKITLYGFDMATTHKVIAHRIYGTVEQLEEDLDPDELAITPLDYADKSILPTLERHFTKEEIARGFIAFKLI